MPPSKRGPQPENFSRKNLGSKPWHLKQQTSASTACLSRWLQESNRIAPQTTRTVVLFSGAGHRALSALCSLLSLCSLVQATRLTRLAERVVATLPTLRSYLTGNPIFSIFSMSFLSLLSCIWVSPMPSLSMLCVSNCLGDQGLRLHTKTDIISNIWKQ